MWTPDEVNALNSFREQNLPLKEIASRLNKTPEAVRVYMTRHRMPIKEKVNCPIVEKLVCGKFVNAKWFTPDREFYELVKISQKRFSDLLNGYNNPTIEEMKRIASVLKFSPDDYLEFFQSRQLNLFESN